MLEQTKQTLKERWQIDERLLQISDEAYAATAAAREKIRDIGAYNQLKVLNATREFGLSDFHFTGTTGYAFDDPGRELLDKIFARVFDSEKALVRVQYVSGTHALSSILFGNLRPGDRWLSIVGAPYDTMLPVIDGKGTWSGSLAEWQIEYDQVSLTEDYNFDFEAIEKALQTKTKLVYIQRSLGYTWRPPISLKKMEQVIRFIKQIDPNVIVMVDNCYGEFADIIEPTSIGADVTGGSLIKNAGGGLAPTGGYVAGREEYVENAAIALTSPGIGKDEGANLGVNRLLFQGFFMAPIVVSSAMEGAVWASYMLKKLNFDVMPSPTDERTDIIQGIRFNDPEIMSIFCGGIQNGAPVDSKAFPEAVDMPGYRDPITMAGGTFVQGSSIELSCDGPQRPPYSAYLQGGLSFPHVQFGVLNALNKLLQAEKLTI